MGLHLVRASESDIQELAAMNKELIMDENSPNPMTLQELKARMWGWISKDWTAELICTENEIVGYALYQPRIHEYFPDRKVFYVRQYFIKREHRRKGYGLQGIRLMMGGPLREAHSVVIDVLEANESGKRFWAKAGFSPYSMTMKWEPEIPKVGEKERFR